MNRRFFKSGIITLLFIINIFSLKAENINDKFDVFCGGRIVTINGNYAIYNIVEDNSLKYGLCFHDETYIPRYSIETTMTDKSSSVVTLTVNSTTYSILPPIYDKIQPVSDGVIAVCINKKWAYVDDKLNYLTPFTFEAAMPPKNGIFKVMLNGKMQTFRESDLVTQFSSDKTTILSDEAIASLSEQLYKEGHYDRCLAVSCDYISRKKEGKLVNLSPLEYLCLLRVQSAASSARNKAMATTLHKGIENKFPGAIAFYQNTNIDVNNSFLSDAPQIIHALTEILLSQIKSYDPELYSRLGMVESLFNMSEYKKAVLKYESAYSDTKFNKDALANLLYICLLHMAGDFESYNIAINRLTLSEIPNNINPLLQILVDAFSNRFRSAIELINKHRQSSPSQYDTFFLLAFEGKIYDYLDCDNKALETYKQALRLSSNLQQTGYSPAIDILSAATLLAYKVNDSALSDFLNKYLIEECHYNTKLFSTFNTLQLSKEWGFSRSRINNIINNFVYSEKQECVNAAFKLSLFEKSILQNRQLDWYQLAQDSDDQYIANLFGRYMKLRSSYSGVDIYNIEEDYSDDLLEMMNIEQEIKHNLYSNLPSLYDTYFGDVINTISSGLDATSLAIDFFQYSKGKDKFIGAWVLTSNSKFPSFYEVSNVGSLTSYDSTDNASIKDSFEKNGDIIWNKLPIRGFSKIFFSPSGSLEKLGIEYMQYNDAPLCVSFDTHRLSSILNIPKILNKTHNFSSLALFGGLDYGNTFYSTTRGARHSGFLKYSLKEVDEIEHLLGDIVAVKKFTGKLGTPSTFRELQYISPDIIHIATHGFQSGTKTMNHFQLWDRFNYYKQNTDLEDEDWLLSSTGLYLSQDQVAPDSINSILRSRDVALCRLNNTALVVLSACNTSDGENSSGFDYILGLNYALQKAQVKNIITSLWNVYDETTYEFMISLYQKLPETSIHNAFLSTVREFWEKHKSNPKMWSSFIMIQN